MITLLPLDSCNVGRLAIAVQGLFAKAQNGEGDDLPHTSQTPRPCGSHGILYKKVRDYRSTENYFKYVLLFSCEQVIMVVFQIHELHL